MTTTNANQQTSPVALTRERLEDLLDAYAGALSHVAWARANSTVLMHEIAVTAAVAARAEVLKAVFG